MPFITRLFVKTALLFLVAALACGLAVAVAPFFPSIRTLGALRPVYFHLFMVGWVTELIAGVGYWMFPRLSRDNPRGSELLAWATYLLLNAGLLLRVVAEPAHNLSAEPIWGALLAASATLQWLGGLAFVSNTWPRIKQK